MKRTAGGLAVVIALVACNPTLAQDCAWRPWAADWSTINAGTDLYPPNLVYNPTNWDYSFSQTTILNMAKDTPTGGGLYALHFFLDSQPPSTYSNAQGSGGFYQEVTVTPGVPIQYSFYWKGKCAKSPNWFEFLLIDGPFSPDAADMNASQWIMRKRELSNSSFGWEQLTDQSTAWLAPSGPTITPTGTTVTVVLKAGHWGSGTFADPGGVEVFFDSIVVKQNDGPNLLVNGDIEDTSAQPDCDGQLMKKDASRNSYWLALTQCPGAQHTTVAPVSPASQDNTANTTLTITGTALNLVTQVQLVPVAGGNTLTGTNLVVGAGNTTLTATFATTGALDGLYDVVTAQAPSPPCLVRVLPAAFELTCPTSATVSGVEPGSFVNPTETASLTVTGTNLGQISGASLTDESGDLPPINSTALAMVGSDLQLGFDLSCAPAGRYDLVLSRNDGCRGTTVNNAVWLVKTPPAGSCLWQPWASDWTVLNLGPDLDPPNLVYDATNWDFSFNQQTNLGTTLDTPDSSLLALHWFLDGQDGFPNPGGSGSGGVFQTITVQPGIPLEYSFYWKGAVSDGVGWFEFLLIDGPFNMYDADQLQESPSINNPSIIRKRELTTGDFAWEQITHLTAADSGPAGPRAQTITPTGTLATVVLKAGRVPSGGMTSLWDNIVVTQSGGPNLIVNGDFESGSQASLCDREAVFQDTCEYDAWRRSAFAPLACLQWDPFADVDGDGDVDQNDFAALQLCYTGSGSFSLPAECACFDRPEPIEPDGDIDQSDMFKFEACASGAGIPADTACDD